MAFTIAGNSSIFPPTPSSETQDFLQHIKSDLPQGAIERLTAYDTTPSFARDHLSFVADHDSRLHGLQRAEPGECQVEINGDDLSLAEMVAVARHNCPVHITQDPRYIDQVNDSVAFLHRHLGEGNIVYGINTGYGGSADTRSADFISMQQGLIQHHNSAVLLSSDKLDFSRRGQLDDLKPHCLPRSVVRGSMLARCNSLMRGHSAVRLQLVQNIVVLLNNDFVPIIPLRGSISASGDLTPLSYIAGALEGNPDIHLDCRRSDGVREVLNAKEALERAHLSPVAMMPKEGLGLMNGTAVSCAAASLALHETHHLALATQVLTGMCTEALCGSSDNYHPFISKARPHPGQKQVAANILRQLTGSKLVVGTDARSAGLYQDRYGLRTSPQWIGPQLEDLMLAQQQVDIELNSTTDNPLVDVQEQHVHHGGNFQAVALTSAMEKARLALQMLGKLIFAQSSEMINPMLNNNLTPNLSFDDPDVSFSFKGVDINMAAYMSELAYLANPVSSHVQSAEMHNQAVNSLALISTRYTMDAVELVSLMVATSLYTVCQALDLHVLHIEYLALIMKAARGAFDDIFGNSLTSSDSETAWSNIIQAIPTGLVTAKSKPTHQRSRITAETTISPLFKVLASTDSSSQHTMKQIEKWVDLLTVIIESSIRTTRAKFSTEGPTTTEYLGKGTRLLYCYVRETLGVPVHLGLVEHPAHVSATRDEIQMKAKEKKTIGSRIGVIYEALRSDEMSEVFVKALS